MAKGIIKIKGGAGSMGSVALTDAQGGATTVPVGGTLTISGSSVACNVGDVVTFDIIPASGGGSSLPPGSGSDTASNIVVLSAATVYNGPLSDNINVGAGQCAVINNAAKIDGNVKVDGGILLITDGANVYGNIKGANGAIIIADNKAVINGNTKSADTGSSPLLLLDSCTISGNVKSSAVARVVINACTIDGNVDCENSASVTVTSNNINGNLKIKGSTSCRVSANTVTGKTDAVGCV